MSKMDMDTFDTYVSSKGYVFAGGIEVKNTNGVKYGFSLGKIDKTKALNWITLFDIKNKYSINYQTHNISEYLKIKNQIKQFGFKLTKSEVVPDEDTGSSFNGFMYRKGKSIVSILNRSRSYEIVYIDEK